MNLATVLKLLSIAQGAAPVFKAIYESAKPLLAGGDQSALADHYGAEYEKALADHAELQAEPIKE